ncbi:MAG: glycosyltransferase, partial [Candidatus Omnitrophica bacterium]|nr:glycosyltransferase [Candidatus Omnitrophota bacterium]
ASLVPSRGLGVDASPAFVTQARKNYPGLEFRHGFAETFRSEETFDYVVLANLVGYLDDVQGVLENLKALCGRSTRLVIHYYNYLWEPLLALGDRLGLRMKQGKQNWLSLDDLENLLHLAGFETVKRLRKTLFPYHIPFVSAFLNRVIGNLPWINRLCLSEYIVARPAARPVTQRPSVSIVVAAKDERGNIRELVRRVPSFNAPTEIIFVDGHSTDGTQEEVQRVAAEFPEKKIRLYDQGATRGKGAAVRLGFDKAEHDVLMILDADISVAPEDMTKFYDQLAAGRGELINGSRLVYPMEKEAMRFLNILGNKFFSMAFTYLLGQRLKDTLCGTKVLFKSDYEKILANRAYFGDFDPFGDFDLLFGAAKLNLKILELPVRYYERRYGDIKIRRFRHGMLLLGMCALALRRLKFV